MLKNISNNPVKEESNSNEKRYETPGDALSDVLSRPLSGKSLQLSTDANSPKTITKIDGVMIGQLIALDGVKVNYPGNPKNKPLPAISTRTVSKEDIGREVALAFVGGDPAQPILLGLIEPTPEIEGKNSPPTNAQIDGEKLLLTGEKEVVLRCGKSSITLTKEGKIILRGKYLLSRSSGVNRIKGGSVQIN